MAAALEGVVGSNLFTARPRLVVWRITFAVLVCAIAAHTVNRPGMTTESVAAFAALAWCGALVGTWRQTRGVAGALTVYIVVFGLFHLGLILSLAALGPEVLVGQGDNSWVLSSTVPQAVSSVCWALAALVLGAGLSELLPAARSSAPALGTPSPNIGLAGTIAMIMGATIFAYVFATSGGLALIGSGYGKVLESVGDSGLFGYGVFLLGMGCSFMVCARGRYRKAGWGVMILFALIALPSGMRGVVLFPILVMVVCEARRRRIRLLPFTIIFLLGLTAISILRQTRLAGLAGLLGGNWARTSPIDGMAEMGYTLYPVVVVHNMMARNLEYMHGQTLVAPVLRQFEALFHGVAIPADDDIRLFNVEVLRVAGPIGGSPVAESYRNGGPLFVILLMLVIGIVVARLDRLTSTPVNDALLVVVFLPLIIQVRNSFAPVPVQMVIGAIFVFTVVMWSRSSRAEQSKVRA